MQELMLIPSETSPLRRNKRPTSWQPIEIPPVTKVEPKISPLPKRDRSPLNPEPRASEPPLKAMQPPAIVSIKVDREEHETSHNVHSEYVRSSLHQRHYQSQSEAKREFFQRKPPQQSYPDYHVPLDESSKRHVSVFSKEDIRVHHETVVHNHNPMINQSTQTNTKMKNAATDPPPRSQSLTTLLPVEENSEPQSFHRSRQFEYSYEHSLQDIQRSQQIHIHDPPNFEPPQPPQIPYLPTQISIDPGPPPPAQPTIIDHEPQRVEKKPDAPSWKRSYPVNKPIIEAKNEILSGEEQLEKDLHDVEIDILKRREAFVERPESPIEIIRTGKKWRPPPESPYIWPEIQRSKSADPEFAGTHGNQRSPFSPDLPPHYWEPIVYDPEFKKETKNFTPDATPPNSPIRGQGTGPLDDPDKRQTRYLIRPAPDGSHRPPTAFFGPRQTPSGGFYPHAPNAVKIIKQPPKSPNSEPHIEVIHENHFHRLDSLVSPLPETTSDYSSKNDYDKIYDLPPHSSQIVDKRIPQNVNVRRRLAHFEQSGERITGGMRSISMSHLEHMGSAERGRASATATSASRHEFSNAYSSSLERYNSLPQLSQPSADDKPRSIMKRRELENREQMLYPAENYRHEVVREAAHRPVKTETVQRFEQTKRTEEVERRVQRKERKDRRSRHHSSSRREEWREGSHGGGQWRSASLSRHGGGHAGYLPSNESYFRQTTTRRDNSHGGYEDDRAFGNGIAHARYGSLSDSLRRGELKYIPNGEVRESHYRDGGRSGQSFHKSYSTRDVFDDRGGYDRSSVISQGRRGSQGTQPFVEFPPTLPRRGREESFHPMHKARSFADWDDQSRAGWRRSDDWAVQQQQQQQHQQHRRRDDEMSRLEDEFRDSLLMPMPNGNVHERDHRTEQIPGGYETYHKENRANAGRRYNRDGVPIDYSEATQEYNFKREQETDGRRR